ncbi:hypothetical protein BH09MYX1_BH09MYX1_51320 [soil metagenome]
MADSNPTKPHAGAGAHDADAAVVKRDWAIVTGPTDDQKGARIVRVRGDEVQAGEIRPMVEGASLAEGAEIVRLKPHAQPNAASGVPVFEVESVFKRPTSTAATSLKKKGPAQVATSDYRDHWDSVFATAKPPKCEGAPN